MKSIITAIIFHTRVFLVIFSLPTQFIRKTARGLHCDRLVWEPQRFCQNKLRFERKTLVFSRKKLNSFIKSPLSTLQRGAYCE